MAAAAPLPAKDYIAWVQRSLNRILHQSEPTDGVDTLTYRDLIEMFQRHQEGLAVTRQIHPIDQDRLIKINHANLNYMYWARTALQAIGFRDADDKAAIKALQKSAGLEKDGWIGAQTETLLISKSHSFPPGHKEPGDKPTPPPPPPPPFASLLERFLLFDDAAARRLAPATISLFPSGVSPPHQTEAYIRRRLAAAVGVARFARQRLTTLGSRKDLVEQWNRKVGGLERWWFGDYSEEKFAKVLGTFDEIASYLSDARLNVKGTDNPWYGSSLPGIRKIRLGQLWVSPQPPIFGSNDAERVQTFVHEAAHIAGRFCAFEGRHYGPDDAHRLADPGMRVTRNADNYGYYAINVAMAEF